MCVLRMLLSTAATPLFHFRKPIILNRVQPFSHKIVYLLPERDISWKVLMSSTKSLPARLLARICVMFGTAYCRTLTSKH